MPYQSQNISNNVSKTILQPRNHIYVQESFKLLLLYSFLSWPDCSQCNRYGPRAQQISVHSCFTPPDWMCSSVCGDGAFCLAHWLFAAHGLPLVQRLLPDQGTEGCHWTVSAGCLWVRLELKLKLEEPRNLDSTYISNSTIKKTLIHRCVDLCLF